MKIIPVYADPDPRFVQVKSQMFIADTLRPSEEKLLVVPLGLWQNSTRFTWSGSSPFAFVRLTQKQ
ncbi:MAG TPA: hypothetical protein VGB45_05115 [Abditibacterium sp.]